MTRPAHKRRLNRRIASLALLALLWAQALVLGHSVAHAGWQQVQAQAQAEAAGAPTAATGHLAATAQCLLMDHLLAGQAPGAVAAALACTVRVTAAPLLLPPTPAVGPSWRRYDARGPPLS